MVFGWEEDGQEEGQSVSLRLLGRLLLDMSKFKYPRGQISGSHTLSSVVAHCHLVSGLPWLLSKTTALTTGHPSYLPSSMQQAPAFQASLSEESALVI